MLYISSRYDGVVYQVTPNGNMSVYVEGMGVATGHRVRRRATISTSATAAAPFSRSAPNRQIFVFATLEPSIAAYHLAFGPDSYLYVTGPTTSSFDSVYRISHDGRGGGLLSRPGPSAGHGVRRGGQAVRRRFARRAQRRGAHRSGPQAELFLSGPGIVGLAFTPSRALAVATTNALYRVDVGHQGPAASD